MEVGYHPEIILAGRKINDNMGNFIAGKTISELAKQGISPLGTKHCNTWVFFQRRLSDLRNTKVFSIIQRLEDYNCKIMVSDPNAIPREAEEIFWDKTKKNKSNKNQDAVILAVNHKEYSRFKPKDWNRVLKANGLFVDIKSVFNKDYFSSLKLKYWALLGSQVEKILVTGSAGFIGMHLCKRLLDDGYRVYGIDNLNDYYDVSLKEARLKILSDYSDFTFNKIDISNLNNVETVFEVFKPRK